MGKTGKRSHWAILLAAALIAIFSTVGMVLLRNTPQASAHGNPEVKVTPAPLIFGGKITIEGENFEEADEVTLALVGVAGEISLGTVKADEEGKFQFESELPQNVHPGSYQLRARGKDATALLNVRVVAGSEGAPPVEHAPGLGFHRGGPIGQWTALSALLAFFALGGLALARVRTHP